MNPTIFSVLFRDLKTNDLVGRSFKASTLTIRELVTTLFASLPRNKKRDYAVRASNLVPTKSFKLVMKKKFYSSFTDSKFFYNITPVFYQMLVRFMEHCSGRRCLLQLYPFVHQNVDVGSQAIYKTWMTRMGFLERRLGHKFFLEEAIHIMHISFRRKDAKLFCSWLKVMIKRISFWKTRSVFKFIKFIMNEYFLHYFPDLDVKGFKVKLKGKISVGGNSRKRRILYRAGETSHSKVELRVLYEFVTVNTFTGVQGLQL
jgi:hypothetical protein